ncbi:YheC/YheD family protein [Alteribacter aurantiacus]|uniref:YheC/YheD family endospore coat-associated protein n=1 Tax=Alteribacter aurantiacus TaxID=254410 RepID=UPI00047E9111|nr:YheC/YheD family protein [Alteribacter aurantiacus]
MYWIKIEEDCSTENEVAVSSWIYEEFKKVNNLQHGLLKESCVINSENRLLNTGTKDDPFRIKVSTNIYKALYFIDDIVYQMQTDGRTLKVGPLSGMTVFKPHKAGNSRVKQYEKVGGVFIVFKPKTMNWDTKTVEGYVYHANQGKWIHTTVPFPEVIYRRGARFREDVVQRYRKLGGTIFNSKPLFKGEVDQLLLKQHLAKENIIDFRPVTSEEDVFEMLDEHHEVVMKPRVGGKGRRILFISKVSPEAFEVYDYSKSKTAGKLLLTLQQLSHLLTQKKVIRGRYIVQKKLRLREHNGSPYDIRVHMQKNNNDWVCNGIECRVASSGEYVTNLAKDGIALPLRKVLEGSRKERKKAKRAIIAFAKTMANALDQAFSNECFADIGMDIAMDEEGKLWFIEANGLPLFNGFKRISKKAYRRIAAQPLLYATQKQGFQVMGK